VRVHTGFVEGRNVQIEYRWVDTGEPFSEGAAEWIKFEMVISGHVEHQKANRTGGKERSTKCKTSIVKHELSD
jgi:hypothetical protein